MKFFKLLFIAAVFLISVTIIILGALYFLRKEEKHDLTNAERKNTQGSYIKLSDGVTHYQLAGPDTGKVVILLHGISVPYYTWDGTFEQIAKNGFRVLRYDQYGRGFSDRPYVVYNNDLYNNQLAELISKLRLKTPVTLVGVSFGGAVATCFTIKNPELVKKLVLIDPAYESFKPDMPELLSRYYEKTHPHERAEMQLNDFKHPENHPDWVARYRVQMRYKGFTYALISTMYNYNYDGRSYNLQLQHTHKPVLLIWGRGDKVVPFNYSDSIRAILNPQFYPVDDAGHLPFLEQPDEVNAAIVKFLKK